MDDADNYFRIGRQGAVVQTINLIVATLVYLPFVKIQDNIFCEEEDAQKGLADEI